MSTQWLYRIVPTQPAMAGEPTTEAADLVGDHFRYLVELRDRGVLILAGRTQEPETFGLVIFDAADEATAREIAESDPAVAAGVFAMTLHPYAVAVSRPALSPAADS